MLSFKPNLLAGASAFLLAAAFSAPAYAYDVDGGGSSLIAPYLAQAFGCFVGSNPTTPYATSVISNPAVASDHAHRYTSTGASTGVTVASCPLAASSTNSSDSFNYLQSSSTGGIGGWSTQTGANLGAYPSGLSAFGTVTYGASDAALTTGTGGEIDVFANGGTDSVTGFQFAAPFVTPTGAQHTSP
ncbi:MAG TPA: hypothetical protein VNN98_04590, partial [Rhizomicrobium sp.]|nr:hypothetical protein [Rhizomicrobium sp.]